ncbi:MAG: tetratricopeptide repeat-containing sensor histidine kinase [Bacteroidetes bacterium]|nr:tetratricopeptide repeat-containing sensor histidine kinase [Bacteroidota bacterium]
MRTSKLTFIIILLISTLYAVAQEQRQILDSLFKELNTAADKEKIDILNNISMSYWNQSLDSSLYFANEALNLAHILNDKKGVSDSYNRIGNVYFYRGDIEKALEFYEKCLDLRLELNDPKMIANIYYNLGSLYSYDNNLTKAIEYYTKGLDLSLSTNDQEGVISFYNRIGLTYQENAKYKEAIQNHLKGIEIAERTNNIESQAQLYNGLGNSYYEISSYDQALKYFFKGLEIYHELEMPEGLSMMYNNLGIVYQSLKENEKALEYYKKALEIDIELGSLYGQANEYNNIGTAYDDSGNKEKALEYYNKSLELNQKIDDKDGIATALNNIGLIYLDLGEYDKAYSNLKKSTDITKELNNTYNLANNYNNLAKLFLSQKQYTKSKEYLDLAIELSKQMNIKIWLTESYDLYHQMYSKLNNYKKALEYYKLYSEVQDSIYSNESTDRIAEMKIKYETENLETENELLKKDNQIHLLELNRQKNIMNYWIAFTLLILALAVLSFSRFRLKKKTNTLLKTKNDQLEETNHKLTSSENNLKELNATKDKFFSIIAHDLKNPFQSLLGFSETLYNQMDELEKEELSEYSRLIYESSQNLFNLLSNLLQWSKSQLGSVKLSPVEVNLYDSIDDVLSLLNISIAKKQIAVHNEVNKDTSVKVDKHVISTVLRNLLNNAVKFTDKKGEIRITSKIKDKNILISVQDSGRGISKENLEKLFKIDQEHSTKGTDNESGSGLGLILCKELVNQSGGDIYVESTLGKGSTFSFSLPLN